jgi:hypothetical protein
MRMGGDHQAAFADHGQRVAMPGRHRHAALGIQTQRRRTLKHSLSPGGIRLRISQISHQPPPKPTLRHFLIQVKVEKGCFFKRNKGLETEGENYIENIIQYNQWR